MQRIATGTVETVRVVEESSRSQVGAKGPLQEAAQKFVLRLLSRTFRHDSTACLATPVRYGAFVQILVDFYV